MAAPTQSIIDTRRHQMFPVLEPAEIERVRRFGKVRSYGAGEALAKVGEVGLGLTIVLGGSVDIVPGADQAKLEELAGKAKAGCPVSKLLNAKITLDATLVD